MEFVPCEDFGGNISTLAVSNDLGAHPELGFEAGACIGTVAQNSFLPEEQCAR